MHHNPEYFPDPETFNPDRFLKENIDQIDSCTFTPFVIGPRNCLGKHLALMEAKCVTAHLLRNFRIRKSEKTPIPMTYATSTIILKAKNVQVVFEKLD
jgi:cytochrome P450